MIIGFVGFLNSGKGSAGDILVKEFEFRKLNFADSVKDVACAIFGWPRHLLEGDTKESREFREAEDIYWTRSLGKKVTPRWALQMIGTECFRDIIHPELWIKSLEKKIETDIHDFGGVEEDYVITDVRFRNEIDWIHSKGGKVICVERGKRPDWYDSAKFYNKIMSGGPPLAGSAIKPTNTHISEWAWIGAPIDGWIKNEGTFSDLRKDVQYFQKFFSLPESDQLEIRNFQENYKALTLPA